MVAAWISNPGLEQWFQDVLGKLDLWFLFGMAAQAVFASRFAVQWIVSERAGRSIVPVSFWWLSLGAGAGLLIYSIYRAEPLFILAQSLNLPIYVRNLVLIGRRSRARRRQLQRRQTLSPAESSAGDG